jgi:predicted amidohydrolase YtcJ
MRRAHEHGIRSAIHAIGDRANSLVLDAFETVGCTGSIEHAQLLDRADLPRFKQLGVVASVQPTHAVDDRDVADRHWPGRTDRAFAYADLMAAGATLRFGSDAPVAPFDPWLTIQAAVCRTFDERPSWHAEQCLSARAALEASTGGRFSIRQGDAADLVVLDADPLAVDPDELGRMPVNATMCAGHWTWRATAS